MRSISLRFAGCGLAALWLCVAAPLHAQSTGTIRGRVVETTSQRPLPDVQVAVNGTTLGAATGLNGEFTIANVPVGERTLTARRIGYSPATRAVTVPAGAEVRAEFSLSATATQLDQIIVTGTGVAAEKRTLGNSITTLDVAQITQRASVLNVSEVLQGKTPGVTLLPGSGAPGTAGEIRIRGAGSLSGYRPVVYVDGIRYNINDLGNFPATGAGLAGLAQSSQVTSALDFINPNDIESIEVLKGPAAATLYGAEAANGVIQIITKKGTRGQQPLRWTARYDRGTNEWALPTPVNYTLCDQPRIDLRQSGQPVWIGCQGVPVGTLLVDEPMRRDPGALRKGDVERLSLSLNGGGDRFAYYVAGDLDTDQGTYYNSFNNKRSARANFSFNPSDVADFAITVNFLQTDLRLPMQDESALGLLLSAARGKPGRNNAVLTPAIPDGWSTIGPDRANAYNNRTKTDRLTLGATLNYRPFEWLNNRLTVGMDNNAGQAQLLFLPGDEGAPTGANAQRTPITRIYSIDYAGSVPLALTPDLQSTTTIGTQIVASRTETLAATGSGLGAPDVTLIGSAQVTSGSNSFTENNSVGYFIQEQLGWRNRLFVTGALRADDNSSFGTNFDWIVYPKFSLSWVLSEEPQLTSFFQSARINTFKFRSAWGRAGRAPSPYSATQTYSVDRVTLGNQTGSALRASAFGNPDLKPEKGEELELGFDAGLLNERLGFDFTFYNKTTTDMLALVATAPSTGFPVSRWGNFGEVSNRGIELGVDAAIVTLPAFSWDSRLTVATNRNRLVDFGIEGKTLETPSGQAYGAVQQHREGYPMGGYWAQLPLRDANGVPIVNAAGTVQLDTASFIGPSSPTREFGFVNTFTFLRNFRLYALLDHKAGHYLFNLKERNRCQTANDNCLIANLDVSTRNPVTAADSLRWRELQAFRQVPALFIEKADFTKLRELSLTYTVPSQYLTRMGASGASITLSGRNLALWSDYSGLDPEVNSYGGRLFVRADAYAAPMARRWVASVNLTY